MPYRKEGSEVSCLLNRNWPKHDMHAMYHDETVGHLTHDNHRAIY